MRGSERTTPARRSAPTASSTSTRSSATSPTSSRCTRTRARTTSTPSSSARPSREFRPTTPPWSDGARGPVHADGTRRLSRVDGNHRQPPHDGALRAASVAFDGPEDRHPPDRGTWRGEADLLPGRKDLLLFLLRAARVPGPLPRLPRVHHRGGAQDAAGSPGGGV